MWRPEFGLDPTGMHRRRYRHFPTCGALVEAVYRIEVAALADAAEHLAAAEAPLAALRDWMRLFVDHIATKQLIAPALNALLGGPSELFAASAAQVKTAIRALVGRAVESGDMRADIDPIDLLRALVGVSNVSSDPGWEASAKRLVDILIAGSRPLPDPASPRKRGRDKRQRKMPPR